MLLYIMDGGGSGVGETVTCCDCGETVDVDYTRNARVVLTAASRLQAATPTWPHLLCH